MNSHLACNIPASGLAWQDYRYHNQLEFAFGLAIAVIFVVEYSNVQCTLGVMQKNNTSQKYVVKQIGYLGLLSRPHRPSI